MKLKWFEVIIVIVVIGTSMFFSFQQKQTLKVKYAEIMRTEEIVNAFYEKSPIGGPISEDAFQTAMQAYAPQLVYVKKKKESGTTTEKLSEEINISTKIGVLQGQIGDIKDEIKAVKDSSFPWWLTLLLNAGGWILGHLLAPLATSLGNKLRDSFVPSDTNND